MKHKIFSILLLSIIPLMIGCDLELQRSFDFDENDRPQSIEPYKYHVYQYLTEQTEFSLLVEAINRADMISVYSQSSNDKTFLMLRNEGMQEFLTQHGHASIDEVPIPRLQKLLNYHIINARVTQSDVNVAEYTIFQTLIPGDDGLISIWKAREYWILHVNSDNAPNKSASNKGTTVYYHNYEFTSGVGHHLRNYVRRIPF